MTSLILCLLLSGASAPLSNKHNINDVIMTASLGNKHENRVFPHIDWLARVELFEGKFQSYNRGKNMISIIVVRCLSWCPQVEKVGTQKNFVVNSNWDWVSWRIKWTIRELGYIGPLRNLSDISEIRYIQRRFLFCNMGSENFIRLSVISESDIPEFYCVRKVLPFTI